MWIHINGNILKHRKHILLPKLLEQVAQIHPDLRVRFSTSHPKDMTDDVLHTMARNENICNYIHLPVQSGSSRVLSLMNRTYDREWYINRIEAITEDRTGLCSFIRYHCRFLYGDG